MITMLLGGLWHGAGWTFVIWGGLHGFYIAINHIWIRINTIKIYNKFVRRFFLFASWALTMLSVVVAWVPFRADNYESAKNIISSMFGINGIPLHGMFHNQVIVGDPLYFILYLLVLLLIVVIFPNSQQIMADYFSLSKTKKDGPVIEILSEKFNKVLLWTPSFIWAIALSFIFVSALFNISKDSEFLYFQF